MANCINLKKLYLRNVIDFYIIENYFLVNFNKLQIIINNNKKLLNYLIRIYLNYII